MPGKDTRYQPITRGMRATRQPPDVGEVNGEGPSDDGHSHWPPTSRRGAAHQSRKSGIGEHTRVEEALTTLGTTTPTATSTTSRIEAHTSGAHTSNAQHTRGPSGPVSDPDCKIERLILHQTTREAEEPLLVTEPAHLDAASTTWFAGYLAEAERRADWHARLLEPEGEVSRLCASLLSTPEAFVAASQALARRMHAQMRARRHIAPGDFVALVYRTSAGRAAALLKLDPDERRLVRQFAGPPERRRVRIRLATGLLPDARALQKCALLTPMLAPEPLVLHESAAQSGERHVDAPALPTVPFTIRLLDTQAGPRSEGVAAFFYRGFLGAELMPSPRRTTRCFLRTTEHWLSRHSTELDVESVLSFYAARRRALAQERVDIETFACEALARRPDLADDLIAMLMQALADLGMHTPLTPLQVDRAVADPFVRMVTLVLDGDARLTVPSESFARLVHEVRRQPDGKVRLVIETVTLCEGGYA